MPCIDTVQGFSFARRRVIGSQQFTAIFLPSMQFIQPQRKNRLQGFTVAFPLICPIPAHNTAATQAACAPPAQRWRAYRQAQHLHQYQIPPPRRTLYRPAQPPYYNKVYKGAPLLWIHARRCSITQTMPAATGQCIRLASCTGSARRLAIWRRVCLAHSTRRGSPVAGGAAGGAEPLAATAASLFGLSPDSQ